MLPKISAIKPAMQLLSTEIEVLPAIGGAVEDLQTPDID